MSIEWDQEFVHAKREADRLKTDHVMGFNRRTHHWRSFPASWTRPSWFVAVTLVGPVSRHWDGYRLVDHRVVKSLSSTQQNKESAA
jgi:hypothetical protein